MTIKVIALKDLKPVKGIGYSRVHIGRMVKVGAFPSPIKLGGNRVAFVETEIDDWLKSKVAERDAA